jgi:hypothetical protein
MSPSESAPILSREQRLRKQAELQSLYLALANLREREATFVEAQAAIPELIIKQINEARYQIESLETELYSLDEESPEALARQFYREAFSAEQNGDFPKAIKIYKSAARYGHPDADASISHLRYLIKYGKKGTAANRAWIPPSGNYSKRRFFLGLVAILVIILILIFFLDGRSPAEPQQAIAVEATSTDSLTPSIVKLIIPDTATPVPTFTLTPMPPLPTNTPESASIIVAPPTSTSIPTTSPTPIVALRPAPRLVGPRDGLVWLDGAIVFEFENLDLAEDELYCINTLRGYDPTNTENWSYPPTGNKEPNIPIQAHVFRVAKAQDIRCIVWTAAIGKGSCENLISEITAERVIGMPRPCEFNR